MKPHQPEHPIRLLEELSLNAWPSPERVLDDGWLLGYAGGFTRRANSVNTLYPPNDDLDEKIRRCEAWFHARGLPVIFKMTPLSLPEELDSVLARHRYKDASGASVQVMNLDSLDPPASESVSLLPDVSEEWLSVNARLRGLGLRELDLTRRIIQAIVPAKCCAILYRNGQPVAVGLGVVQRGYIGLFDIVTDQNHRNQGIGRQLVLYLLHWGRANNAAHAYLQVVPDNAPAVHLYQKLGFREVYQYWYREKRG